jgi:serine/threonine-protein kinase
MMGSSTSVHALSLRAPIANEEERALFQRRLAAMLLALFILAAAFWVANAIAVAFLSPQYLRDVLYATNAQFHLATTAAAAIGWLVLRKRKLSVTALGAVDATLAIGLCLGWVMMVATAGLWATASRGEFVALLACSYTLVLRASLVPSTPARTALIHAVAMAPLLALARHLYGGTVGPGQALAPELYIALWWALGVSATTVITYVIYGLRLQVRKAMQLGQYVLEEKIGEGGMGAVYRARHAMLRRPTAIKLLADKDPVAIERFEREVQITAELTHPNTIAVFDYGRTPDGVFYYAMEYLDGTSLEDLVEKHGPQPIARVVHVLLQVCGALEEAHAAGLVHRDIKPANIMLTERGGVADFAKVLDFGLVKESAAPETAAGVTGATTVLGTPYYMAPEAITDPQHVDGRADLYALGATASLLLTGERVFDGSNLVEICSKHLHEAPAPPSSRRKDVPPELDRIVLACLAKKAGDRPKDAAALTAMLRALDVPAWTREDARAWWSAHARPDSDPPESIDMHGQTIAIALDDRASA